MLDPPQDNLPRSCSRGPDVVARQRFPPSIVNPLITLWFSFAFFYCFVYISCSDVSITVPSHEKKNIYIMLKLPVLLCALVCFASFVFTLGLYEH